MAGLALKLSDAPNSVCQVPCTSRQWEPREPAFRHPEAPCMNRRRERIDSHLDPCEFRVEMLRDLGAVERLASDDRHNDVQRVSGRRFQLFTQAFEANRCGTWRRVVLSMADDRHVG